MSNSYDVKQIEEKEMEEIKEVKEVKEAKEMIKFKQQINTTCTIARRTRAITITIEIGLGVPNNISSNNKNLNYYGIVVYNTRYTNVIDININGQIYVT